jgi:hypothetical protein
MTGTAAVQAPSAVDTLMGILQRDYYLAATADGRPFAVRNDVPSVMIPLRGNSGLRIRLATDMYRHTGRAANNEALTTVLNLAEGAAMGHSRVTPNLRLASHSGSVFLDLGRPDGKAVEIRPGHWRVINRPPVLFHRTALTGELPVPAEEGDLDRVRDLINIVDDNDWALYVACRIASLFPGITHPIEVISGPPGSAKTGTTRITSNWIDASPAMQPVPRDERTWAAMAGGRYVMAMDNVSGVSRWWSDALCKAASGDGWVDRALYTDGDLFVTSFQSVIILNGITLGGLQGDLADRLAAHRLSRLTAFRSDDEVAATWALAHPSALAWLLDRTVQILADMQSLPSPAGSDRLTRFSQIVSLVDRRWRTNAMASWRMGRFNALEDIVEGDTVAMALTAAVRGTWEGTATELLHYLVMHGNLQDEGRSHWTARSLSDRIERTSQALGALGWRIDKTRLHGGKRIIRITPPVV